MEISKERIKTLGDLSKLNLTEEETDKLEVHLNDIFDQVDRLDGFDLDGLEETIFIRDVENVFREDCVLKEFDREELLRNAPMQQEGCFSVPKIVE